MVGRVDGIEAADAFRHGWPRRHAVAPAATVVW